MGTVGASRAAAGGGFARGRDVEGLCVADAQAEGRLALKMRVCCRKEENASFCRVLGVVWTYTVGWPLKAVPRDRQGAQHTPPLHPCASSSD